MLLYPHLIRIYSQAPENDVSGEGEWIAYEGVMDGQEVRYRIG